MGGRTELRTTDSPSTLLTINQYDTQYWFLSYHLYMHDARYHVHMRIHFSLLILLAIVSV